jgi:plasmid maintenance system antidote protein VapI
MAMYNPPHPGEVIKELCLQPLGLYDLWQVMQKTGEIEVRAFT